MKSKVNQAAVYTKPTMRKALFEKIKGRLCKALALANGQPEKHNS